MYTKTINKMMYGLSDSFDKGIENQKYIQMNWIFLVNSKQIRASWMPKGAGYCGMKFPFNQSTFCK